jgi:hypothetical protein
MANDCREQASAVGDRMKTRLLFFLRFCILSFAAILIISSSSTLVRGEHFWSSEQSDPLTTYFEQSQQFQAANSTSTSPSLRAMREQQAQHLLKDPRFSSINKRRKLESCIDFNPYLSISISTAASSASSSAGTLLLQDVENVTVTVSGILDPCEADWIAVFTPATAPDSTNFCPLNEALYLETGDVSPQPLTCLYPVKVQLQLPWTLAQLDNNIKIRVT